MDIALAFVAGVVVAAPITRLLVRWHLLASQEARNTLRQAVTRCERIIDERRAA